MDVRRLTTKDAHAYRSIMLEAYENHPDAFTSTVAEREARPMSWWSDRLGSPDSTAAVFGAWDGRELVGVVGLSFPSRDKLKHKSWLFGMYVRDGVRRRGLGQKLVMAAIRCAAGRIGVRVIQLTVTDGNRHAERLYHQCGFARFGLEPFAVASGDGFLSKIHMSLVLDESIPETASDAM